MSQQSRPSAPTGYTNAIAPLINGAPNYIPNNGYQQAPYSPNAPGSEIATITFSAAPADGSTLVVPDSATGLLLTYHYGGSPGPGNIPLVAGGGTAAQAATATAVALAAQLQTWTASNFVANRVTLNSLVPGRNVSISGTQATGVVAYNRPAPGNALPAMAGKARVQMPYFPPSP